MSGKVYLVGAGPGDPGLLTLKGKALIERADCVVYDFLVNEAILSYAPPECEMVFAGKRSGRHAMAQERINKLLAERALAGKLVVRLKGGDPLIYGRGGEEAAALASAGVGFEIVPGVSAGNGVPAYAGIPLTQRGISSSIHFLTGHEDPSEAGALPGPDHPGTLVFFMGQRNLGEIAASLIRRGHDPATPSAVIRWGATPDQEVVTAPLAEIASKTAGIYPPALAVIGEVVNLRSQLNWYETLPLFGKRIVVTRPRGQATTLIEMLRERGAQPVALPTIELRDPPSWDPLDQAIRRIERYNFLLATSANGVRKFGERLAACGFDARSLNGIEIGAIGPATAAEFARLGIRVDFVPREYRAEGLIQALDGRDLADKAFLIPRARVARDLAPRALAARGARVDVVEAYYAAPPEYRPDQLEALLTPPPHCIVFTSSSTATNFARLPIPPAVRQKLNPTKIASIGPVTSETLRGLGVNVDVEAAESTVPGLVAALETYFRRVP